MRWLKISFNLNGKFEFESSFENAQIVLTLINEKQNFIVFYF